MARKHGANKSGPGGLRVDGTDIGLVVGVQPDGCEEGGGEQPEPGGGEVEGVGTAGPSWCSAMSTVINSSSAMRRWSRKPRLTKRDPRRRRRHEEGRRGLLTLLCC